MEPNDASEVGLYESDPFKVRHRWMLHWDLWRLSRIKKKRQSEDQEFLPRSFEVLLVRGGLETELDPDEERFDPQDIELVRSLLTPLFARYALEVVGTTLRHRSDDGTTEVTSVMVTYR